MNITSDKKSEVHTYARMVSFDDAPTMEVSERNWSYRGKSFQPRSAITKWDHGALPKHVTLYGRLLKKDGTVGVSTVDLTYSLTDEVRYPSVEIAPQWLKDIFLGVR